MMINIEDLLDELCEASYAYCELCNAGTDDSQCASYAAYDKIKKIKNQIINYIDILRAYN